MLKAVAISFVGQITYVFVNFAVFKCFGIHISLLNSCGLASLAIIAGIIPISWLGIGVREGIYIALLPRFGASMAQILFVISFLLAVNYLLCVLGGLIELARTGWNISSLKKISPQ
jgi:uncharacterized membrane protein YbhN (UPF0104 family)